MYVLIFYVSAAVLSFTYVENKLATNLTFGFANKSYSSNGMLMRAPIYENCYCGQRNGPKLKNKIVGGREASEGEFPWMVALYFIVRSGKAVSHRHLCGGTLMSSATVVSAAHCVAQSKNPRDYVVTLGTLKTTNGFGYPQVGMLFYVRRIIRHPGYTGRSPFDFDFAVLRLSIHVNFNYYKHVRPACFPHARMNFENLYGDVCGWGTKKFGRKFETKLRTVRVQIFGYATCIQHHGSLIGSNSLCAGDIHDGGKDACTGDSGGPLTSEVNGKCYLAGVVSSGFGCGVRNKPGIYMNVLNEKFYDLQRTATIFFKPHNKSANIARPTE